MRRKNGLASVQLFLALLLMCIFSTAGSAAPPQKNICPAPGNSNARSAAVETACEYFGMTTKSWGLHSAFGPGGEVITCLHFSCQPGRPSIREDCLGFNPHRVQIKKEGRQWILTDGRSRMKVFDSRTEAIRSLKIIRYYGMNKHCFVGRPQPSMEYWLVGNYAPDGQIAGEDCISFTPSRLQIRQEGSRWLMTDGRSRMRVFPNKKEAEHALTVIRHYGFNKTCYVGRPGPSMTYFRK